MQDADKSYFGAKTLWIRGQFRQRPICRMVQCVIQVSLVCVGQGIQLTWDGKNYMKVRCLQHVLTPQVDPFIHVHSLAHGTVTVFTGIVVNKG